MLRFLWVKVRDFLRGYLLFKLSVSFTLDIGNTGVDRTNLLYGQLEPEVTKVISVHGTIDPWHKLGVLKDLNELAPAIVVTGKPETALLTYMLICVVKVDTASSSDEICFLVRCLTLWRSFFG